MATWADFEVAQPGAAQRGRELIYANGAGEGLFVTVRGDQPPRVHPVNVGVVDGRLYTFVQAASAKRRDLDEDGRYALHAHIDPAAPSEFMVRGHAVAVDDGQLRARLAADWFFTVSDTYPLYELLVEHALLGERATGNDWPPQYTSWSAARA